MPDYRTVDGIFLGDVEFWRRPIAERHEAFAALREETRRGGGMCFHEEVTVMGGDSAGPGYWSAVTYDEVQAVSRNPQSFSSASGVISNDPAPEYLAVGSIIVMDDPRHTKIRRLVQKAFTPRTLAAVEESVRERARRLIDAARETGGSCDFVEAFAAPLPLQVICDMLGIPEQDEQQVFAWTNVLLGVGDPEFVTVIDDLKASAMAFLEYAVLLGAERAEQSRRRPQLPAHAGGGRRRAPQPVRVRRLRRPAGPRRQRDDPQRHLLGHAAPHRPPRPAGPTPGQLRGDGAAGRRGDRPVELRR